MGEANDTVESERVFKDLFVNVVEATSETQEFLTAASLSGLAAPYQIPRVGVEAAFELEIRSNKTRFFFFREKSRRSHTHRLRFSLVATPDPPPLILSAAARPKLILVEPPFLVSALASQGADQWGQIRLLRFLISKLELGPPGLRFEPDESHKKRKNLHKEVRKLQEELAKTGKRNGERRMLFFDLGTTPPSYLAVRLADDRKKDGLFRIAPDREPAVAVYSFQDDGLKDIAYEPLHALVLTMRGWLQGAPSQARDAPSGLDTSFGIGQLSDFVEFLAEDYSGGIEFLSRKAADVRSGFPVYYDLVGVEAELGYSVQSGKLAFDKRTAPDGSSASEVPPEEDYRLIESRARVRVERTDRTVDFVLELLSPEFILTGGKLRTFVRAAREKKNAEKITAKFARNEAAQFGGNERDPGVAGKYRRSLEDREREQDVVVLLAYKGEVPSNSFLVIWPGFQDSEERDFAFSCKLEAGALRDVRVLMNLRERLVAGKTVSGASDESSVSQEDGALTGKEYKAFHRFFGAVLTWQHRTI